MSVRLARLRGHVLPNGWLDLIRQVALFGGAYLAYRLVAGLVAGRAAEAFSHATQLISIEQSLHIFIEPGVQNWAAGSHALIVAAVWIYLTAQTTTLVLLLLYIYIAHNRCYYFVRNMLFVAMALGLIGYIVYPTAPPRFLPEYGFIDTVSEITHTSARNNPIASALVNPYAAVPSMHVAFATMFGWTMARLVRTRIARVLWCLWPAVIAFVTIITGNHFLLDAVFGLLVALLSEVLARRIAALRPHAWTFTRRRHAAMPAT